MQATTGIVRYDGGSLLGYDTDGVSQGSGVTGGATKDQVRAFAPHWAESSYYNIYIVNGFDAKFEDHLGITGSAAFPGTSNRSYDAFIKAGRLLKSRNFTLAHEFGHSMGLKHTFEGATSTSCPPNTNNDCTKDGDLVCDTQPVKVLSSPTPNNTVVNPCTDTNYDGVQYNVMDSGTDSERKFTPGQRDRVLQEFFFYRESLTQSLGATDLATNINGGTLIAASCTVTSAKAIVNFGEGPTLVKLGTINNKTNTRFEDNQEFYTDYSSQNCINPSVYTDLTLGQIYTLQVNISSNPQYIKAWIDYNNDGAFENSELVATSGAKVPLASDKKAVWTASITPPATAILNTPLRLRVKASEETGDACADPDLGQVEDYTVKIKSNLSTIDHQVEQKFVSYSKNENKLISNDIIGDFKIYDISGKLIQAGTSNSKEIKLVFSASGVYILKTSLYSIKFNK